MSLLPTPEFEPPNLAEIAGILLLTVLFALVVMWCGELYDHFNP